MAAKYAAFEGRRHVRSKGAPKVHAHRRDDPMTALDDYQSLCGSTYGSGTVALVPKVDCKRCLSVMKKEQENAS